MPAVARLLRMPLSEMPLGFRLGIVHAWIAYSLFCLRLFCGLGYEISGTENIPDEGFIVMSKHSSTWETIAIQGFFRPMVWVVKQIGRASCRERV